MNENGEFRRVAILGAGLIGASFGAAVQRARPEISIVAYDRPDVLRRLRDSGSRWESSEDLDCAIRDADLIYVALPVGATIEALPDIAAKCSSHALVTDSGSTKAQICRAANKGFGDKDGKAGAKFLGGHPIAGRELAGPENACADIFRGAKYALIGEARKNPDESDTRVAGFVKLLREMRAEPVWMDAETHDWAMAVVSHMPQLVTIALGCVVADETDETGLPTSLAGNGLRDMLRTAGSSYEIWRDICLTNRDNIARSLDRVVQTIDFLRTHLASRELKVEFRNANEVYKIFRNTD